LKVVGKGLCRRNERLVSFNEELKVELFVPLVPLLFLLVSFNEELKVGFGRAKTFKGFSKVSFNEELKVRNTTRFRGFPTSIL